MTDDQAVRIEEELKGVQVRLDTLGETLAKMSGICALRQAQVDRLDRVFRGNGTKGIESRLEAIEERNRLLSRWAVPTFTVTASFLTALFMSFLRKIW